MALGGRLNGTLVPLVLAQLQGSGRADGRLSAKLLFRLVSRRYERGSILITSNQSLAGWGQVFGDQVIATAILDRLLHHSTIVNIKGESYRSRRSARLGCRRVASRTWPRRSPWRSRAADCAAPRRKAKERRGGGGWPPPTHTRRYAGPAHPREEATALHANLHYAGGGEF